MNIFCDAYSCRTPVLSTFEQLFQITHDHHAEWLKENTSIVTLFHNALFFAGFWNVAPLPVYSTLHQVEAKIFIYHLCQVNELI